MVVHYQSGQHLSTQIYWRKVLSSHRRGWRPSGENLRRGFWWSNYYSYKKNNFDETFIRKLTNVCKSVAGIDASQLYPTPCSNPCWPVFLQVGVQIQRRKDSRPNKTKPLAFKIWSCPIFNKQDPNVKLKTSTIQADRKKIDCCSVGGFLSNCNLVFEAMGCFYHFCPC